MTTQGCCWLIPKECRNFGSFAFVDWNGIFQNLSMFAKFSNVSGFITQNSEVRFESCRIVVTYGVELQFYFLCIWLIWNAHGLIQHDPKGTKIDKFNKGFQLLIVTRLKNLGGKPIQKGDGKLEKAQECRCKKNRDRFITMTSLKHFTTPFSFKIN